MCIKNETDNLKQKKNEEVKNIDIVDEFMNNFEENFKVESSKEINTNLLKDIFHNYICPESSNSRLSKYILKNMIDIEEKLTFSLDEKQEKKFEIYDVLHNKLMDEYALESFVYGFAFANELNKESNSLNQKLQKILK